MRCGWWTRRGPGRQSNLEFVREWVKWGAGLARVAVADSRRQGAGAVERPLSRVGRATSSALARPVLRHRIIPNFYAESERVTSDTLVERLLEAVPTPRSGM